MQTNRLLNRHTVRDFADEKLPQELIDTVLKIAAKTPTSLNSRPVRVFEISEHLKNEWISHQGATKTAPHLFALTFSMETAEKNIRAKFSEKFECDVDDEKVEGVLDKYVRPTGDRYPELQLYLVAGYFSATLEALGATGCWIRGFDKDVAKKELNVADHETVGLLFAAGFEKK